MSDDHLMNLKGWLLRHAPWFQSSLMADMYYAVLHMNGEMAIDSIEREISQLENQNAYLWMEKRPLFQKINRLIDERQGYHYVRVLPQEASTD
jgi:cell division protein FtsB